MFMVYWLLVLLVIDHKIKSLNLLIYMYILVIIVYN